MDTRKLAWSRAEEEGTCPLAPPLGPVCFREISSLALWQCWCVLWLSGLLVVSSKEEGLAVRNDETTDQAANQLEWRTLAGSGLRTVSKYWWPAATVLLRVSLKEGLLASSLLLFPGRAACPDPGSPYGKAPGTLVEKAVSLQGIAWPVLATAVQSRG